MRLEPTSILGAPFSSVALVAEFPATDAILRERADIGCLLLSAAVDADRIIALASQSVGVDLPLVAGAIRTNEGRLALWLSPRSWIVHCNPKEETMLAARLGAAFPDKLIHAALFADYLCWLELSGPGADILLRDGGFISLEREGLAIGYAKRTLIAGVAALVVRKEKSEWLIGVERSRAKYFVDWMIAADKFGATRAARRNS